MSAPGLYRCGSASQPRMFATMFASVFSSTPAPMVTREPTCVRSGPAVPFASVPRMVWQLTQMLARNIFSASVSTVVRGLLCTPSHASNSLCVWTTTRMRIHACSMPQNLAALALIRTRAARGEPKMVGDAGKHVHLRPELGDPEAVDDIGRGEVEVDRCVDRDVQLVRGLDAAVAELPPPLVAGGRDAHRRRDA